MILDDTWASCHIDLELLDLLTSQLDREIISHNVTVEDLKNKISGVFQQGQIVRGYG